MRKISLAAALVCALAVAACSSSSVDTIKKEPAPRIQLLIKQDRAGTGTAPLNFFVGLHDYEVETLRTTTSKGTGELDVRTHFNCVVFPI